MKCSLHPLLFIKHSTKGKSEDFQHLWSWFCWGLSLFSSVPVPATTKNRSAEAQECSRAKALFECTPREEWASIKVGKGRFTWIKQRGMEAQIRPPYLSDVRQRERRLGLKVWEIEWNAKWRRHHWKSTETKHSKLSSKKSSKNTPRKGSAGNLREEAHLRA